ncbi:MAG: hydantoinase B/oxoprolinase family protein [Desulfovibrionales bacterium]
MSINPILLQVFKNRFSSIAEEMGVTLIRTAYSPNIKERRDLSCALFDDTGQMVAQAEHIPVHLGSMPLSVQAAMERIEMREGDMVVLNDPFQGGTHLPDVTLVAPVFAPGSEAPDFYVANRAHHSDIGGMSAGSMPLSDSIYQEGLIIPPLKIIRKGERDENVFRLIMSNVRTPREREGDFAAQIMANITGVRRLKELIEKYGGNTVHHYAGGLVDYAEKAVRRRLSRVPNGVYRFADYMDEDGTGTENIRIDLKLTVDRGEMVFDFTGSADQVRGCINAVHSITLSAVLYVVRSLVRDDIPANSGCLRPVTVRTRQGSLLDAARPAAVAGGNVETSQRIVDVILGALSRAMPDEIPAASQGSMNNVTVGGTNGRGESFTYYETLGGGMGASARSPGESAVHSHMTNTLNTPVEALEYAYPLRVTCYRVREGSGGAGRMQGGNGMIRETEFLCPAEVTVLSERRKNAPYGLNGGGPGRCGKNSIVFSDGSMRDVPGKFKLRLEKGDRLRISTPGGGGYGSLDD